MAATKGVTLHNAPAMMCVATAHQEGRHGAFLERHDNRVIGVLIWLNSSPELPTTDRQEHPRQENRLATCEPHATA
jgi:hypothetical protein